MKGLIDRRVNRLAELLSSNTPKPQNFRTQDLLGIFEDNEFPSYGIIYKLPQSGNTLTVSL
jgi:hypothetical protein